MFRIGLGTLLLAAELAGFKAAHDGIEYISSNRKIDSFLQAGGSDQAYGLMEERIDGNWFFRLKEEEIQQRVYSEIRRHESSILKNNFRLGQFAEAAAYIDSIEDKPYRKENDLAQEKMDLALIHPEQVLFGLEKALADDAVGKVEKVIEGYEYLDDFTQDRMQRVAKVYLGIISEAKHAAVLYNQPEYDSFKRFLADHDDIGFSDRRDLTQYIAYTKGLLMNAPYYQAGIGIAFIDETGSVLKKLGLTEPGIIKEELAAAYLDSFADQIAQVTLWDDNSDRSFKLARQMDNTYSLGLGSRLTRSLLSTSDNMADDPESLEKLADTVFYYSHDMPAEDRQEARLKLASIYTRLAEEESFDEKAYGHLQKAKSIYLEVAPDSSGDKVADIIQRQDHLYQNTFSQIAEPGPTAEDDGSIETSPQEMN
jgi:hypothetical protein